MTTESRLDEPTTGGSARMGIVVDQAKRSTSRAWARGVDRLHAFWFGTIDLGGFLLVRTLFGAVLVYFGVSMLPAVSDFFGSKGIDPRPPLSWWQISVLRYLPVDVGPWMVVFGVIACGGLLVVGRYCRFAAPLAWLLVTSLYHDNRIIWNGGDDLVRIVAFYLGAYCLISPSSRVDGLAFRRTIDLRGSEAVQPAAPEGPAWAVRLLQFQIVVIYWSTLIDKVQGATWIDGTATSRALQIGNMSRFPVPGFLRTGELFNNVVTWATLLLELALPLLLISKRWRRLGILVGIVFHLAIEYALRVGVFSWVMIVLYASFLPPEDVMSIRAWLGRVTPVRNLQKLMADRRPDGGTQKGQTDSAPARRSTSPKVSSSRGDSR